MLYTIGHLNEIKNEGEDTKKNEQREKRKKDFFAIQRLYCLLLFKTKQKTNLT